VTQTDPRDPEFDPDNETPDDTNDPERVTNPDDPDDERE
jgi:hypothetical protein